MKIAVIGGGAAGLMAAAMAAKEGADVTLLEKNEKLGKKIYITGKGRCNFTNSCSREEFLANVIHNSRFLSGAIARFTPDDCMHFFESEGMPIKVERGIRVLPLTDKASDVTRTLERVCERYGVKVILNRKVTGIAVSKTSLSANDEATDAMSANAAIPADLQGNTVSGKEGSTSFDITTAKVQNPDSEYGIMMPSLIVDSYDKAIVATGGLSYPSTGSTGDGYYFAQLVGHTGTECRPALTGLELRGDWFKDMQGLSLKNVELTWSVDGKKKGKLFGEMLFTHYGISGPIVLTLSSNICHIEPWKVTLSLDLKPALSDEQLDARILRDFADAQNKDIYNCLKALLPHAMIAEVLKRAGIPADKKVNVITREERQALLTTVKKFAMLVKDVRGFEEAIITSGGISVKEINPKTFESKLCPGLYFCGEVLDVDALTGGFNLQTAFATGYCAGKAAAGGIL